MLAAYTIVELEAPQDDAFRALSADLKVGIWIPCTLSCKSNNVPPCQTDPNPSAEKVIGVWSWITQQPQNHNLNQEFEEAKLKFDIQQT